ncbi:phosphate ABC transporter permease PstA [Streptomyces silvisoli]|uniref:Phosphate transport system permease protein PstA n=1 Tax=Streptomyces silvisoli TaxID=3034235 RepID=A0ABT5ZJC7_9ACTN|nr:phosphate ABC transporter permease PstA [Streptomyces silvisoli]MDF3289674.1 phosphate ABC transporter permease PstA [Streptomyces silvisoli]
MAAPTSASAARRGLPRRMAVNAVMTVVLGLVTVGVVALLLWILAYVAGQGLKYLGPMFLTRTPPGDPSQAGGGFANGIVGSVVIVGIATALSVPIGIAAAVHMVEYRGRLARACGFLTDVLIGLPSIVTGAFVYALWVAHFGFSGFAGAVALGLIMLPLIIRATAEVLRLVPVELREASLALGVSRARTIMAIVLPTARSGITTGVMLAVARAMGETAPLLLTALGNDLFLEANPARRMSTLSLQIFSNAITGFATAQARAWAGTLTLIVIVLVLSVGARLVGRRGIVRSAR